MPATDRSLLFHTKVGVQFVISLSKSKNQILAMPSILTYSTVAV